MARTNTPIVSTYETKRIAFFRSLDNRYPALASDNTKNKDFSLKNLIVEENPGAEGIVESKYFLRPRPTAQSAYTVTPGTGSNARGAYVVQGVPGSAGVVLTVFGNTVYKDGVAVLTITNSFSYYPVGICSYLTTANVPKVILLDGIGGWVSSDSGATWTKITSANFPTPHIPNPVYLDGYVFVAKTNTQDIYNCVLNDPLTWNAGDFISAEMYGDFIVALTKNNHFIYAVGQQSIEYFYDAANPTGTPLARHESAVQQFGGISATACVQTDTDVYLVGTANDGDLSIWCIDGFKAKDVGTSTVKQLLTLEVHFSPNSPSFIMSVIRLNGRKLIMVKLPQMSRTLVYDVFLDLWTEWTTPNVTFEQVDFLGTHFVASANGDIYITGTNDATVYRMGLYYAPVYTEKGLNLISQISTSKQDFGSINRKTMSRLSFIADSGTSVAVTNTVTVEWSDDDYNTWSSPRTVTFSNELPSLFQLGTFRRRAFRFKFNAGQFFRFEGIEVDINKGTA